MKRFTHALILAAAALALAACTAGKQSEFVRLDAAAEIDRLSTENRALQLENTQLRNASVTESRLAAKVDYFYAHRDYQTAKAYLTVFEDLYPASARAPQFAIYSDYIAQMEAEEARQVLELYQQTAIDSTGIWQVARYVSGNPYIRNAKDIDGTYFRDADGSGSARARFLINSKEAISLKVFEGDSKASLSGTKKSPLRYQLTMINGSGKSQSFSARSTADRVTFNAAASAAIHEAFMNGGSVGFSITVTAGAATTAYEFTIPSVQNYNNAYRQWESLSNG